MLTNLQIIHLKREFLHNISKPLWESTQFEIVGSIKSTLNTISKDIDKSTFLESVIEMLNVEHTNDPKEYIPPANYNIENHRKMISQIQKYLKDEIESLTEIERTVKNIIESNPPSIFYSLPIKEKEGLSGETISKKLCGRLIKQEFITPRHDQDVFISVFQGNQEIKEKIQWTGTFKSLSYFVYLLVSKDFINCPDKYNQYLNTPLNNWSGNEFEPICKWINDRLCSCFLVNGKEVDKGRVRDYKRDFLTDLNKEEKAIYIISLDRIISN